MIMEREDTPLDPLKEVYHDSIAESPQHRKALRKKDTALLVIDMQYLDAARGHGIFADVVESGVPPEAEEYYFSQLEKLVIPNIRRLQEAFREEELEVIHTRIMSLTQDGRDRSPGHKRLNLLAAPGSKEAEFLEEIGPQGDEIIINKTASGAFPSTNLHYVLNNLGVEALFVTGVYTNECVSSTVRDASDLGFMVTVVSDACTTVTPELHQFSVEVLRDRYARIMSTDEALAEVRKFAGEPVPR